ncbi:hypothetical protein CLAFUW4_03027 [Fulvia fulva]|uniref:Uncharacterized protein n=1 Tax=Passalora fulva TaxID=5499 RepID=A0A9Q8L9I5_PASFU|nr:uncharacterized protein CLAFUR5_03011 [Fulvia fulva]KAK4631680.1 hypothetical protein CLAFUR4_03020 [Fulvia fulva]KAK4633541.1 hypothetical protein CLAFUR0_03023 [Fulvia fulva]UJO13256.1 hypothetical protein CLAFUR5_03011 [Fulvia fulva]WPV11267.1 hypothetical protein CLAFUW4_03027 [Fulvia fulva]WPV25579.1 hypothetical protein CLAFUW7_03024 [Fulvia fulva]
MVEGRPEAKASAMQQPLPRTSMNDLKVVLAEMVKNADHIKSYDETLAVQQEKQAAALQDHAPLDIRTD